MFMPDVEFIKDGLKIVVIFLPLIYFLVKSRNIIVRRKGLFLLIFGFSTMLLGGILDFTDEFAILDNVFLIGARFPYHEAIEDFFGIFGFILFALGIAIEIRLIKNENLERERMIRKLEEQTQRLKKFDGLKSKFVQDVSHEFRSPLNSIKLSLSNIIDGLMGEVDGKQKEALSIGKKNLDRLSRLVADLLTLSQIESGKMVMHRKLNDISSLAQEAYSSLKPMFENRNIAFNRVCYLDEPNVWCDGDKIIQVFVNILSNGLKYSPPNTQIAVRISGEGQDIRVEIEDQGKGMSEKDLEKLFDRFERIDAEKENGTGLGLAISKEIIDRHHGKVWVESKVGQGTRFIFTVPKDLRGESP